MGLRRIQRAVTENTQRSTKGRAADVQKLLSLIDDDAVVIEVGANINGALFATAALRMPTIRPGGAGADRRIRRNARQRERPILEPTRGLLDRLHDPEVHRGRFPAVFLDLELDLLTFIERS